MARRAFTLAELLVVLGIVAILAAMLLPAIQMARESGRRSSCVQRLKQLAVAVNQYESSFKAFPPGMSGGGFSLHTNVLPFIEQAPLYSSIDHSADLWSAQNAAAISVPLPVFRCPSDGAGVGRPTTNFAANYGCGTQAYGYNGMFRPINGVSMFNEDPNTAYLITAAHVTDGLSNTAAISEMLVGDGEPTPARTLFKTPVPALMPGQLDQFAATCAAATWGQGSDPWTRGARWVLGDIIWTGYTHVLTPGNHSCTNGGVVQEGIYTPVSAHPGGVDLVYADAHLVFVTDSIDQAVWRALGSRNGGETSFWSP